MGLQPYDHLIIHDLAKYLKVEVFSADSSAQRYT
jgi:hypothetical protein